MKRILFLLSILFLSIISIAQNPLPRSSPSVTAVDMRLWTRMNFKVPVFNDTATALVGGIDSIGLVVWDKVNSILYVRDTSAGGGHKWTGITGGSSDCDTCITNISYRAGNYVDTLYYTNANGDTDWYYVPVVDGLISGGIVTYAGFARTYDVSEAFYRINGVFYSSPYTQIVLNALADTDSSRTDLFVVTTSGTATTVEGVESANHLAPQPDLATQIGLTTVGPNRESISFL